MNQPSLWPEATPALTQHPVRVADGRVALGQADHAGMIRFSDGLSPWDAASLARQILAAADDAGDWEPCRGCGAPILFALTQREARMPLNIGDDPKGNLAAWRYEGRLYVRGCPPDKPLKPGEFRVSSHFWTCPKSAQFRKPRPATTR
jgi:hypothetical protein